MSLDQLRGSPWAMAAVVVVAAFAVSRVVLLLLRPLLRRAARRSRWRWDDLLVETVALPISCLIAVRAVRAAVPWLALDAPARALVASVAAVGTSALVMWIAFRLIDVGVEVMGQRPWARARPASRSLLAIAGRALKAVLVVLAAIVMMAELGVSVASLIAGLGIGGLALALAAQKTVENLFGTMSIAVDQPLREGDFARIGDHIGTVESIGLRSTRVRTLDRTIVTIPNGDLADQRIESYTARDRFRLVCTLGLVYGTTAAQVRTIIAEVEAAVRAHPAVWPDAVVVYFTGFGSSSLDVEVMAWFMAPDWNGFQAIRQDVLLRFMEIVEANCSGFAFPTRTVHLMRAAE